MDRIKRPARLLGLICVLPVALTGCRTIVPTKPAAAPGSPKAPNANARPTANGDSPGSIVKTDFHRTVTADQSFNVHIELGRQMFRDRQYEPALGEFKKALEACTHTSNLRNSSHRNEQHALAQRKVGDALLKLGKFAEAEERYKHAVKLTPNDPRVWNNLGYCYYVQSRWADSERCLRRAAKLDPDSPLVNTNLGLAVAADGRTADALELLSHSNGKAVGHANLAYLLASQKRDVEAREEYRKALALEPRLTTAQQALAQLENPATNPPLVDATSTTGTRAPAFVSQPMAAVATPGSTAKDAPISQATAAPAPNGAATGSGLPVAAMAPSVNPAAATGTDASLGTDRELRPTSLEGPAPLAPQGSPPAPAPIPVPIQVGPGADMTPPLTAPTQPSAPTMLPTPNAPDVPGPAAARQQPVTRIDPVQNLTASPSDDAVRLTSHATIVETTTPEVPNAPAPIAIPMPVPVAAHERRSSVQPAAARRSQQPVALARRVSPVSAIPMPIPPPSRPAKTSAKANRTSIPMPVPVSRHLASPTSERSMNATSAPAIDTSIRPASAGE